ncbi:MAG: hypothetical protein CVU06_09925, partial [Bacteroidetes bacterium HGW-Bacteroidetes-22]
AKLTKSDELNGAGGIMAGKSRISNFYLPGFHQAILVTECAWLPKIRLVVYQLRFALKLVFIPGVI